MGCRISLVYRLLFSIGLLFVAAACSSQLPQATPSSVPTTEPPAAVLPSPIAAPTLTPASALTPPAPSATPTLSKAPQITATSRPPASSSTAQIPSQITVTLADDGKSIFIEPNHRFLLDLGAEYDWQITIDNSAVLAHVPNTENTLNQGLYQAGQVGQAHLSAVGNPKCYNAHPRCLAPSRAFSLHVGVIANPPAAPTAPNPGIPPITFADNGKIITLHPGDQVLVNLGTGYNWDEPSVSNPSVLDRVVGILVARGAQGVYEAKAPGSTSLSDSGSIVCPANELCPQLEVNFTVQVEVR